MPHSRSLLKIDPIKLLEVVSIRVTLVELHNFDKN